MYGPRDFRRKKLAAETNQVLGSGGPQALLDGSSVFVPLTHTAIPTRGSIVPTFTRATTATGQKWDEAGYLDFTALAGEVVWKGARRERNLLTTTEDFSNAAWLKSFAGAGSYPVVTADQEANPIAGTSIAFADKVVFAAPGAGDLSMLQQSFTGATGNVYLGSFYVKAFAAGDVGKVILFRHAAGGGYTQVTLTAAYQRVSLKETGAGAATFDIGLRPTFSSSSGTVSIYLTAAQLEDVTAQTTQTAGEYVSVGVPSDWAGDELVTNGTFDTDTTWIKESGWTIGGGAAIAATASATLYQTDTLAIGTKYVASFSVSSVSAGSVSIRIGAAPLVPYDFKTAAGTYSVEFVADAVSTLVGVIGVGFTGTVDNINVKPAYYHGSMVDGVKCFPTDRSGNPISTSGSYPIVGYVPWEARTNLQTYSNDLRNTAEAGGARPWTETGIGTCGQVAIGPDGTTSAWVLNDTGGAALYLRSGGNVAVSASVAYTTSVFVKKTATLTVAPLIEIKYTGGVTTYIQQVLNPVSGTVVSLTGSTAPTQVVVSSHNADYWRVSITATTPASTNVALISLYPAINTDASATLSTAAQGANTFYGVDIQLGAFATPYIPTTTVAVARNANVLTYTGADVANIKTLCATFRRESGVSSVGVIAALSNGTINEYAAPTMQSATNMRFEGVDGGVLQWATSASNAYAAGATSKVVQSTATNDIKMAKDGVGQTADTTATLPTIDRLEVGHLAGSYQLSGNVGGIYGWTRNLSQSELNAVTA